MNPSSDYISEQIALLETEVMQHELLIRRQKHVINSLKTMVTKANANPQVVQPNSSSVGSISPRLSTKRPANVVSKQRATNSSSQQHRIPVEIALSQQRKATSNNIRQGPDMRRKQEAMQKVKSPLKVIRI
jgi:hypothetical protein